MSMKLQYSLQTLRLERSIVQLLRKAMEVVMGVEEETFVAPDLAPSPVSSPKKLRRLRKVRIPSEDDSAMATATSQADEIVSLQGNASEDITITAPSSGVIRESAEDILRRFGKEDRAVGENAASLVDVGKKRKAVQSTIRAAVVDMAKETLKVIQETQSSEGGGGLTTPNFDSAEVDLELASHEEQGDDICQDFPAPNRKKRSISMKRCSLLATSLTVAVDNQASADDNAMVDEEDGSESPTETSSKDRDNKEVAKNEGAWNVGWSDDLDGEAESMEAILEKARKMVSDMSNEKSASAETTNERKRSSDGDLIEKDTPSGKKKKGKKEQERTREDMYAESQRLLRESKGVAFVAPEPVMKPVSSVLEKIRQRRLQLGCSQGGSSSLHSVEDKPRLSQATREKSTTHVDLTIDEDTEVEIEVFNSNLDKTEEVGQETIPLPAAGVEERLEEYADGTPGTPENQTESARIELVSSRTSSQDSKHMMDQSQLCTQDLLCNSQLSPATDDSPKATPLDHQVAGVSDLMGLDTEIQDETVLLRSSSEELNKENRDPSVRLPAPSEVYTTATHVRGLIDDEAEDEDEDVLADNAEEEVGDGYEDLQDLIAGPQEEKAGDRARRAALHRKWLDQQDTEQTDDILERLRTGRSSRWKGRDRVVSCLDDDDDFPNDGRCEVLGNDDNADDDLNEQVREDSCSAEKLTEEASMSFRERARKLKQLPDHMLDANEDNIREDPVIEDELVEDEEEHEKAVLRKIMLEQSKEQFSLMSAAEDESSREVFGLIKRVNVAPPKPKPSTGRSELRNISSLPSALPSETISFLGRNSSSSSLPPPGRKKCNSGGSRSFIFSRDDSNSNHGIPSSNQSNGDKETELTKSGSSERETKSTKAPAPAPAQPQPQAKKTKPSASSSGPSLFDLLRKQASELEQAMLKPAPAAATKNWGNDAEAFSVFAPKSFTLSKRKS